jgi:riboflavin synthase
MFTGLVQEIGTIKRLQRTGAGVQWSILAPALAGSVKIGDSVNISGACQTVESIDGEIITGTAIPETLRRTTYAHLRVGDRVNLELALRADDRLGGHMVSGHIDVTGRVAKRQRSDSGLILEVTFAPEFDRWVVEKGSIAIDGVSLTVATLKSGSVSVALIPETARSTTLGQLRAGKHVNLEFDQTIKAVTKAAPRKGIDMELLADAGY